LCACSAGRIAFLFIACSERYRVQNTSIGRKELEESLTCVRVEQEQEQEQHLHEQIRSEQEQDGAETGTRMCQMTTILSSTSIPRSVADSRLKSHPLSLVGHAVRSSKGLLLSQRSSLNPRGK
jgi:hypothetical protein